jgi:nucleotide-binding universal stress UspA family protein
MAGAVTVPVDGTPASAVVLPTALRVAHAFGADVRVVRVFDVSHDTLTTRAGMLGAAGAGDAMRADMTRDLEQIAARARAAGVPATSAVLESEEVARVLLDDARRHAAAAIVMMTNARGALGRALVGSVSDRVMREAPCPVVLVPVPAGDQLASVTAIERPLRQVLVPVDGSETSVAVAERLRALPGRHELVLTLFRAIDPATLTGVALPERADGGASLDAHLSAEHGALDELARRLAADGLSARALTVEATDAAEAIVTAARDEGVDLIAMSTRGQGGMARFALGSTADAVVRSATVPVLLMTPNAS